WRIGGSGSSSAVPRAVCSRRSWTASPATSKETARGKRYAASQAPHADACSRSPGAGQGQGEAEGRQARALGRPAFLLAAARPREVDVRVPRLRLRGRVRLLRRRLWLDRHQRRPPELLQGLLVERRVGLLPAQQGRG